MLAAYRSGYPDLEFARQAGAVPSDATKTSHPAERELFKLCALGVQYGMEAKSLAGRIGRPEFEARKLLQRYMDINRRCWTWLDSVTDHAILTGQQQTVFGWTKDRVPIPGLSTKKNSKRDRKKRTTRVSTDDRLVNFLTQGNGGRNAPTCAPPWR